MHEDFGSHAGREPDPAERGYRLDVLLDGVTEAAALALMHRIADLLIEAGLAAPEDGDARAIVGLHPHTWTPELADAVHLVIPRAVPQSPDLGANYSPN
ncbi:hypothetical protein OM076_12705 [Solirubrobacter ginsenosidimutans]|uniref:Uncharacterized protein n=1 Tax=Solirubrobacter ginsenosidimutans TaxID=490573 RepID=A0A9X3S1I9_9ACTN|nr:hypothetical protein [Solirubrobacter ginsenosidimutans]MDA0161132.1 hypothetical protein [Solirubrobacter ginsenosidimutans]